MISYGDMLDAVDNEEAKNAPTPDAAKKEDNEDNIEDVIDIKKEDEIIED